MRAVVKTREQSSRSILAG
ncbi:hypothetical protein YPPY99_1973, partial [Yersinia pestis PY-99]